MTATNLGLNGNPIRFLGAYVTNLNSNLGLAQSPSTCNVTLVEDDCVSPQILFEAPNPGDFRTINVGQFTFAGIVTGYTRDIRNIGGRTIQVNLADPREIMSSVPMIIAPGYRAVAAEIAKTDCSVLDVFGAFDDVNSGLNLSNWNQAGIPYSGIAVALKGGPINSFGVNFNVVGQVASAFGERYRFILDEVSAKVDPGYRVNSNLLTVNDLIQDLASRHSFDWYVESQRAPDDIIDVTIKTIDRSTDNTDIGLDAFLASNSGFVIEATRGFELRNDLACAVLLGAPVEAIRGIDIEGMANNPVDLSELGFAENYLMTEEEMRYLVTDRKDLWQMFVAINGDLDRYTVGGAVAALSIAPLWETGTVLPPRDLVAQHGVAPDRQVTNRANEEIIGKLYDKLKAVAEASYGKRFLFSLPGDVETIDAAWTVDGVSGGVFNPITGTSTTSDPNEYFRNENGKTRCYVEFKATQEQTTSPGGILGFGGSFVFGKGLSAPQPLTMDLAGQFNSEKFDIELDKSDWLLFDGDKLYVAGTIEEDNVVRIDSPVLASDPDEDEANAAIRNANQAAEDKKKRNEQKRNRIRGAGQPILHPKAYQATRVLVPTKNKFLRYGPVFSSNIQNDSQGKLVIDQDDGFSPWEFGGQGAMLTAMQLKVDNASSSVKNVESATIVVEGLPKLSLGDSLGLNSNINSISIGFGNQGARTTYELRSFLRAFGELSRDELIALSLFARRSGARTLPQDSVSFINKYRPVISKQFAGRGARSSGGLNGGARNFE